MVSHMKFSLSLDHTWLQTLTAADLHVDAHMLLYMTYYNQGSAYIDMFHTCALENMTWPPDRKKRTSFRVWLNNMEKVKRKPCVHQLNESRTVDGDYHTGPRRLGQMAKFMSIWCKSPVQAEITLLMSCWILLTLATPWLLLCLMCPILLFMTKYLLNSSIYLDVQKVKTIHKIAFESFEIGVLFFPISTS